MKKARQILREKYYQGKGDEAHELVRYYIHGNSGAEGLDVVKKLINDFQIRIPAMMIDHRLLRLQKSNNVDELTKNLSMMGDHLTAANRGFYHKKHLLASLTDIRYGAIKAREKLYNKELKKLQKKYDKWAEQLRQQIATAIRGFYRTRGDVPISDNTALRIQLRGNVLDEWDQISSLLDWDKVNYKYMY